MILLRMKTLILNVKMTNLFFLSFAVIIAFVYETSMCKINDASVPFTVQFFVQPTALSQISNYKILNNFRPIFFISNASFSLIRV